MPFKDYNLNPSANTEIGDGLFIGPNMDRNNVRPALQQIAADGKELSDQFTEDATRSEAAADRSEAARDIAIATADFDTLAEAQAAFPGTLSEGDTFSYLASGLMMRGQIVSGVATALPGPYLSAEKVGHTDSGANAVPVSQRAFNIMQPIRPGMFTSLADAFAEANATGRTLIIDEAHSLTAGLTMSMSRDVNIELTHRALFEYTGLSPIDSLLRFYVNGHKLNLTGSDWEMDANNLAAFNLRIEHDSDATGAEVHLAGLRAGNVFVGPGFTGKQTSNVWIVGKFDMVEVEDVRGLTCLRSTNTAGPINHALDGINQNVVIARSSATRGPKHMRLRNLEARDTLSPDPQYANCDSFAFFQNFEDGATFVAEDIRSYNGQGRAIKGQCGSAQTTLRDVYIYRDVQCITSGSGTNDISLQYERGLIDGVVIEYEGANVHNAALAQGRTGTNSILCYHTPGTNANGELDYGLGPCAIRNVDIRDRSTGGHAFSLGTLGFSFGASHPPRQWVIDNWKVTGGLVKYGFDLSSAGLDHAVNATFNAIQATFDTKANGASFFLGNSDHHLMVATFTNCQNLGADELRMSKTYAGVYTDPGYGSFVDGGGNQGFYRASGLINGDTGLIERPLANYATAVRKSYSCITEPHTLEIATGATVTFPPLGDGWAVAFFKPRLPGGGAAPVGQYEVAGNAATITTIKASSKIVAGSGGVEPTPSGAASEVLLWWNSATKSFSAKAIGDTFYLSQIPVAG